MGMDTFYNKYGRRWLISKQHNPDGAPVYMVMILRDREVWKPISLRIFPTVKEAKKFIDAKWGTPVEKR